MAMESKADFLRQLEIKLSTEITAADMSRVMVSVADVLDGFQMETIGIREEKDDLKDCYLSAMQVSGRSQKTIDRYDYQLGRLMDWLQIPTRRVTVYHLRAYLAAEKERGLADSTLEGIREIFSAYFNWLHREGLIEKNPTANLGTIKVPKVQRKTYSAVEIDKLNSASCQDVRDRAIINFLGSTGCRISEMTELNRDDVNLESLECVVHGKGEKWRTVFLSHVAGMLLKQYLEEREDSEEALFIGKRGDRITPGGVRLMLNRVAERAGVQHVHPHKFRRTLATTMARHGMPVQEVANILGHEKLDTTMKYVVLNKEDTKSAYRRYAS